MNEFSTAYLIFASLLIAACAWVHTRRRKDRQGEHRMLLPLIVLLIAIAISGLWVGNAPFIRHWFRGDPVEFAIRTPFSIPAPAYYVICLVVIASPVVLLLPPIFRRPWLVASIAAFATFPITYSALTPGC